MSCSAFNALVICIIIAEAASDSDVTLSLSCDEKERLTINYSRSTQEA
jgi:hypothetical protein